MTETSDTERTRVQTYVPAYQKATWADHAEELGMTQSEFVRTMVQAGRRGFTPRESTQESGGASSDSNPRGERTEDVVVARLAEEGPLDWDELVDRLAANVEDQLDDALTALQDDNRVQYRGREGGYVLTDE
jgi:hypothetical protein